MRQQILSLALMAAWVLAVCPQEPVPQPPPEVFEPLITPKPASPPVPFPPLPPNAVMGYFPIKLDDGATEKHPPEWLSPYLSVRMRGKGTLRAYGFIRGDYAMATERFDDIQIPQWVLPIDPNYKVGPNKVPITTDDGFNYNLYPRLTRLGLEYYHPEFEAWDMPMHVWGRIETDFLVRSTEASPINPPSRELMRLRLAYAAFQRGDWSFVIGQDWDLFSPLLPVVQAGTQMAYAGNLGDRRPCAYISYDHDFGEGVRIQFQNGICLANAIDQSDQGGTGIRDNEDYGLPGYQARLGFVLPSDRHEVQPVMFGVGGIIADDDAGAPVGRSGARIFPIRGISADLRFPINHWLTFQGEAWTGYNLNDFRGGIGQGVNTVTGKTIQATGGWGEFVGQAVKWHRFSLGAGLDKPMGDEVPDGGRTRNLVYWASSQLVLDPGVVLGLEYYYWMTQWKGFNGGTASLIQLYLQANF
ncbi:MAG: hypothetical protein FJ261_08440 [Planctomycetes bacterium]|nr:hypothetical protein [Planctomycetota bacterium]